MKNSNHKRFIIASVVILIIAIVTFSISNMPESMGKNANKPIDFTTKASEIKKLNPQTTCPVHGNTINKELFTDYNGKRIYVCCESCISVINKDPEGAIKKLASLGQKPEDVKSVNSKTSATSSTANSISDSSM